MCYLGLHVFTAKQILASAFAILLFGCASSSWNQARDADTAEAYRAFLRDHPNDPNAEAAEQFLSEKDFEAASKQHTVLAYKRFLDVHPDSSRARDAEARLEALRFNAAKEANTAQAWRLFLRDHPKGSHREEAERLLADAEFKELAPGEDTAALAKLVRERADDPRRVALEAKLDEKTFLEAKAQGAFALYAYLRDFPAGAHRQQAMAALFALKIRGLLVSGQLDKAREEVKRSPLASQLPELPKWIEGAALRITQLSQKDPLVQAAQPGHYLRSLSDLERALQAPDPLDRWQAAQELSQHVTIDAIDPLLQAFRTARNPLIRQHAFTSLRTVLRSLPPDIADYEIASRLEPLRATASSAETWIVIAALLDVSGRLADAAIEYQRAWDQNLPDPLILRRWIDVRRERKQPFSAAVAARQLALWAHRVAKDSELPPPGTRIAVSSVRELCAAALSARAALEVIRDPAVKSHEFREDVQQFEAVAVDAVRLADARLKDAELVLRTQDPHTRLCDDRQVAERIQAGIQGRSDALRALTQRGGPAATLALAAAREVDPSPEVRALAASLAQSRTSPP